MRQRMFIVYVLLCLVFGMPMGAAAGQLQEIWSHLLPEGVQLTAYPVAYAERAGERARLAVWGYGSKLYACDHAGRQVWSVELSGDPQRTVCVADLDGDGWNELLVNAGDAVVCVRRGGRLGWRRVLPDGTEGAPAAADVTGDGRLEVIVVNGSGAVYCLNDRGRVLWRLLAEAARRPLESDPFVSRLNWNYERYDNRDITVAPALGDVDGDGRREIVVGNEPGFVYCLGGDGRWKWQFRAGSAIAAAPVIADLEGDGQPEVIVGSEDRRLFVLGGNTGRLRLTLTTEWGLHPATAVADLDHDGRLEIIAGDQRGVLYCFDPAGKERWRIRFKGPRVADVGDEPTAPPAIADVDGDGELELVQGIKSREKLYVISAEGRIEDEFVMESGKPAFTYEGGVRVTPALVDLDGDRRLEIVAGTRVTGIRCLRAGVVGKLAWLGDRGTADLTGAVMVGKKRAFGSSPAPRTSDSAVGAAITLQATPAGLVAGVVQAEVTRPARIPAVLVTRLLTRRGGRELRIDQVLTAQESFGIAVPVAEDWPASLECILVATGDGRTLARKSLAINISRAVAEAQVAVAAAQAASALNQELALGWADGEALVAARATRRYGWNDAPPVGAELARRRLRVGEELAGLQAARQGGKVSVGSCLAAWSADPWEAFHPAQTWPGEEAACSLAISLCQDEREAGGLNLLNLASLSLPVQVSWGELTTEDGARLAASALEVRQTTMVPRYTGEMVGDVLLPVQAESVISIEPMQAAQLFVTADAQGARPGHYRGTITLRELRQGGRVLEMPVEVTVWPVRMPAQSPVRFCTWAYLENYPVGKYVDKCIADLVAHKNNVFCVTASPKVSYDHTGALSTIDWADFDAMVARYRKHGMLLLHGWNPLRYQGPSPEPAGAADVAFAAFTRALAAHMEELGLGFADWAVYIMDEPGLEHGPRIQYVLDYGKRIREADPRIRIYTDPVLPMQMDDLAAIAPYIDIWCPEQDSCYRLWGETADMHAAERLALMHQDSDQVWTYECFPRAKKMSPLGYYRHQGWLAQMLGMNGLGFWTYGTDPRSPWEPGNDEYVLVYPGPDGPLPSKRWEACRDGVEDWTLVWLARQASPGQAAEIDRLVAQVVERRATWQAVGEAREKLVGIIGGSR